MKKIAIANCHSQQEEQLEKTKKEIARISAHLEKPEHVYDFRAKKKLETLLKLKGVLLLSVGGNRT